MATAIALRNELSEIGRVSGIVEDFGHQHGIPADVLLCVNLALDEVITNVISYAYADAQDHDIVARLSIEGSELIVEVEDDGRPFNPLDVPEVDLDTDAAERPIGGLGVHVVRTVMDALDYRRENGRNIFVMKKKIA